MGLFNAFKKKKKTFDFSDNNQASPLMQTVKKEVDSTKQVHPKMPLPPHPKPKQPLSIPKPHELKYQSPPKKLPVEENSLLTKPPLLVKQEPLTLPEETKPQIKNPQTIKPVIPPQNTAQKQGTVRQAQPNALVNAPVHTPEPYAQGFVRPPSQQQATAQSLHIPSHEEKPPHELPAFPVQQHPENDDTELPELEVPAPPPNLRSEIRPDELEELEKEYLEHHRAIAAPEEPYHYDRHRNISRTLYVRTDDYRIMLSHFIHIQNELKESEDTISRVETLKKNQDVNLAEFKNYIEDIQRKLIYIDKTLFT